MIVVLTEREERERRTSEAAWFAVKNHGGRTSNFGWQVRLPYCVRMRDTVSTITTTY